MERAKSESPELTVSVHDYPSSRSPENQATSASSAQNSSQQVSTQPIDQSEHIASSLPLTRRRNETPARHHSPNTRQSSINPSSHRGYHILRSTQQERPSQVDPIETDDGLSQEKHVTNDTLRSKLGLSRSTSLNGGQSPRHNSHDDRGTARSRHVSTDGTSRLRLASTTLNQVPNPDVVPVSTSVEDLEAPPNEPPYESPSRLPTPRRPRGEVLGERSRHSVPENVDLNRDGVLHPREGGKPKDHDLESNAASTVNQQSLNADHSTIPEKIHVSGRVLGHPLNDEQPETVSTITVPDTIACSQGSTLEHVNEDQTLRREMAAPAHTQNIVPVVGKRKDVSKKAASKSQGPETQVNNKESAKRVADEERASAAPLAKIQASTTRKENASISKGDPLTDIAATAVARPEDKKISAHESDHSTDKRQEREESSQDQEREAATTAKGRKAQAGKATAPLDPLEPYAPEEPQFLKPKTTREGKVSRHAQADDSGNSTEQRPEESKITKDPETDAAEKLKAEEEAKRLADAIARTVAATRRRPQTPSSARQKRSASKQVNETPALDAGVQRLREASAITNQPSSSPSIRKESAGQPRSMTPLFPSSCMKPSKGALRTSESSSTRRSVSFNDDPIAPPGLLAPAILTSGGPRGGKAISAAKADQSKPKASQLKDSDNAPATRNITTKVNDSKPQPHDLATSKTPSEDRQLKPKIQTKLNVTRDVKLKGRAQETARPQKTSKEQEIVISSDSEDSASTFYSDEDGEARSAKAGPSKKRKLSNTKDPADTIPDSEPETVQQPNVPPPKTEAILPRPSDDPEAVKDEVINKARAPEPSRSRSPAQYMSKSRSASAETESGSEPPTEPESKLQSASESGSQFDTESASDDESISGSDVAESEISTKLSEKSSRSSRSGEAVKKATSTTPVQASNRNTPAKSSVKSSLTSISTSCKRDEPLNMRQSTDKSERSMSNGTLRRPSKATLSRTQSRSVSSDPDDDEKQMAHETSQQLRREHRESIQASQENAKPAKQAEKKQPTPAPKPTNSRFPSLTGLRGRALKAENNTTTQAAKPSLASKSGSQPVASQVEEPMSSGSSGSEDESSESDDETNHQEGQSTQNSQVTPKSQGRPIRGIREIMNSRFNIFGQILGRCIANGFSSD